MWTYLTINLFGRDVSLNMTHLSASSLTRALSMPVGEKSNSQVFGLFLFLPRDARYS